MSHCKQTKGWMGCLILVATMAAANAAEPNGPSKQCDAKAFFTTTAYGLAGAYAWSPDGTRLLAQSDETGIFNAYSLDSATGKSQPLTASKTDSTFAVSFFPRDTRALVTADSGGNE